MKTLIRDLAVLMAVGAAATSIQAQVVEKKTLTVGGAREVIAAAVAEARRLNAPGGVIAVVDDGGNLMALERLDGTFAAGANISIGKARTSVLFKKPTRVFEEIIKDGRTAMVSLPDAFFTPLQGGLPIIVDGQIVGGVGVSGAASAQQDEQLAAAGANALNNPEMASSPVIYIRREEVKAAFAKGAVLFDKSDRYMVHASRRDQPGMGEVHTKDADIIYVLEGTATFVTGGSLVEPHNIALDEIRGREIVGGATHALAKGDVVIVPAGTPHWFKEVNAPFLYYVVKAR